jgi:Tfp pilus assembly protein PilO
MQRWYARRLWIYGLLAALLLLDVAVYLGWLRNPEVLSDSNPAQVARWEAEVTDLEKEVARLQTVREQAPHLGPQLDQFVSQHFPAERSGYSQVATDLDQASLAAQVDLNQVGYKPEVDKDHPDLLRVQVALRVGGGYMGLLRFLQELERSPRFYLIEELSVSGASGGSLQVELSLTTYFRRAGMA